MPFLRFQDCASRRTSAKAISPITEALSAITYGPATSGRTMIPGRPHATRRTDQARRTQAAKRIPWGTPSGIGRCEPRGTRVCRPIPQTFQVQARSRICDTRPGIELPRPRRTRQQPRTSQGRPPRRLCWNAGPSAKLVRSFSSPAQVSESRAAEAVMSPHRPPHLET